MHIPPPDRERISLSTLCVHPPVYVPHLLPYLYPQLLRHPARNRHRCHSSRLGAHHAVPLGLLLYPLAAQRVAVLAGASIASMLVLVFVVVVFLLHLALELVRGKHLSQELGQLCALSATGFSHYDGGLVLNDAANQLVLCLRDRQIFALRPIEVDAGEPSSSVDLHRLSLAAITAAVGLLVRWLVLIACRTGLLWQIWRGIHILLMSTKMLLYSLSNELSTQMKVDNLFFDLRLATKSLESLNGCLATLIRQLVSAKNVQNVRRSYSIDVQSFNLRE